MSHPVDISTAVSAEDTVQSDAPERR